MDILLVILLGLEFGSFANVCIYRWPRRQSITSPVRSHCPWCRERIRWYDNIPILSFFHLGRACRQCRSPISWRYPFIEFLMSAGWAGLFFLFRPLPDIPSLFWLAGVFFFFFYLVLMTMTDLDWKIIPDQASIGLMALGLLIAPVNPLFHGSTVIENYIGSLTGLLVGGGTLFLISLGGKLIFKKEAMGGGDIKLLAGIGAFLGWEGALSSLIIAAFMGGVLSTVALLTNRLKRDQYIPFGPFLSGGAFLSLLIRHFYPEFLTIFF